MTLQPKAISNDSMRDHSSVAVVGLVKIECNVFVCFEFIRSMILKNDSYYNAFIAENYRNNYRTSVIINPMYGA